MRPMDQEMTVIEKIVCYLQFPRGGGTPSHAGPRGEAPGSQEEEGERGKSGPKLLLWFLQGGMSEVR